MFIGCCSCVCVSKISRSFDLAKEYGCLVFHDDKIDGVSITGVDLSNGKLSTDEIASVDWETVVEDIVPGSVGGILVRFWTYLLEGSDYVLWPHSKAR